jgi:hypothetical protein
MDQALGEPRYAAQESPRIVGGFFCVSKLPTGPTPNLSAANWGRPRRTSAGQLDRDELDAYPGCETIQVAADLRSQPNSLVLT